MKTVANEKQGSMEQQQHTNDSMERRKSKAREKEKYLSTAGCKGKDDIQCQLQASIDQK
jgi:hypothetical protein